MSAMAEEVAFSDGPRKHNRMTCSNESRHDQSIWNDAISRSGLDSEQIFMAIKKLLRCTVCLEYHTEANQCKNGHLICRQCTHQLERGLQQETNRGTCPTCRITLFPGISRCLLATQLSAELPTPCLFCNLYFRQSELERHETSLCLMRPVKCKYNIFGCLWKGKANEAPRHERNCSVSKRSVRDVEAIIQEKFYQRSKRSNDSSNSWHEIVNLFKERPLGVFVCVREATLHQVMRENRRNEFRFQCTTGQLSQTGQFNATIELTINLDELKFYYRTKLHSGFTELVKFRLLTIHGYDLDIPTADRLRAPKSKHSHEWQKFHCHFNVCDSKLMALANKFTELATENGADFALRLEFLVIFENVHAVRMSRGDYHGWNVVIPASPTESQINEDTSEAPAQEDSTRLNNNGHHEEDDEDEDNITPPPVVNNNRGQMEGTWDSTPDELNIPPEIAEGYRIFIDEVTEGVVVAMNEAANRELQREDVARVLRFEELPPSISMRNNNALGRSENEANDLLILGELEAEKVGDESKPVSENESEVTNDDDDDDEGSPRNCSNVGKIHASDKSPRVVRSEAHIKAISSDKHSQRIAWKSKTTTTKRFGQTFDRLAPYLTRGHMWQNFEAMKCKMKRNRNVKRNSKVFKRRKVTKPRKRISKDILPATPGLAGHMVTLLTPITSYWKTMKRISVDLLEKGHQMLKSLRTSNRETDSQNLMEMPTLSRRTATAEWIAQPIGDGMIARSGGDTPGWLFN